MILARYRTANLLDAVADSDFRRLFDRESSYVWHTLRRLGVPVAEVEDVAHEVFLQVYRHWQSYDPERPLRPWLFSIAYRRAKDYRRQARHKHELVGYSHDAPEVTPGSDERGQARGLVAGALDALDLPQRAVFILHEIEGFTMPEVAAALDIRLNTAYSRLRLARAKFTSRVREMLPHGWEQ